MQSKLLLKSAEEESIKPDVAVYYLNLYVGEADWYYHLSELWKKVSKKYSEPEATQMMRKIIACATMLPLYDRTRIPELPENLLYWCSTYSQFSERDWVAIYKDMLKQDLKIEQWRNQCLSLGIVYPIEYSPVTRQAFNWLFGKAEDTGAVTDANKGDMIRRFQNLVLAYGGNAICSVFIKHEHKIKKMLNWRTGYFFEHALHEVYTIDQLVKIKKAELVRTNAKLIRKIRVD